MLLSWNPSVKISNLSKTQKLRRLGDEKFLKTELISTPWSEMEILLICSSICSLLELKMYMSYKSFQLIFPTNFPISQYTFSLKSWSFFFFCLDSRVQIFVSRKQTNSIFFSQKPKFLMGYIFFSYPKRNKRSSGDCVFI